MLLALAYPEGSRRAGLRRSRTALDFRFLTQILHAFGDILRGAQNITKEKSTVLPQAHKQGSESPTAIVCNLAATSRISLATCGCQWQTPMLE